MSKLVQKSKKKAKAKQKTPEGMFNEALERYQRFKHKNAKFEQEMRDLIARVRLQVDEYEIAKHEQVYALTQKLIPFFSKKSLSEYLREALFDWIDHNMCMLAFGPYAEHFDMDVLERLLAEHCDQHSQNRQEKTLNKLAKDGVDEQMIAELRELGDKARQASSPEEFEDLLRQVLEEAMEESDEFDEPASPEADLFEGLFGENAGAEFSEDDGFFDNGNDEFEDLFGEEDRQHKALDRLFKASSINKIFRRITKKIHPDLESDEGKKAERHQQMCQLIEARENKDIAYILQLYKDTFGTLPEQFPEQDYVNLTQILKAMTERLAEQKLDALASIPFGDVYYDMFYRKTKLQEAAAVRSHIQRLKMFTKGYQQARAEITSIASLKPYLQDRMEYAQLQALGYDEDDIF
ncbi:MAG TPA: hypothetical protein VIC26_05960 [Marinagarivorans sp.]